MNKALERLFEIAKKPERTIIGLMSGTSLDGLDIALCRVKNDSIKLVKFKTVEYPRDIQKHLHRTRSKDQVYLGTICWLNTQLAYFFATEVNAALSDWGVKNNVIDLIASHGQTLYHDPDGEPNSTFQIVDADHITQKTGIITISDFRQKHVVAGGQGAPLAVYLDEFLLQDEQHTRVALNLGGIANLTVIAASKVEDRVLSTDVGPANTLINEAMQKYFHQPYDNQGITAAKGNSNSELVKYLLLDPFFRKQFPKSTGQELFNLNWVEMIIESHQIEISHIDLIATLTQLTVKSISRALDHLIGEKSYDLILSGGGIHNQSIIKGLEQELTGACILSIENFGITADSKEAVLVAYLGDCLVREKGQKVGDELVHLGKISLPN